MSHQPNEETMSVRVGHNDDDVQPYINTGIKRNEDGKFVVCEMCDDVHGKSVEVDRHEFNTETEALAFISGYQRATEHALEEYDRIVRQYTRMAAQVGMIERFLDHADVDGTYSADQIIATVRKAIS